MGKPKKETLHKMFDYLISQYLQKVWYDVTVKLKGILQISDS